MTAVTSLLARRLFIAHPCLKKVHLLFAQIIGSRQSRFSQVSSAKMPITVGLSQSRPHKTAKSAQLECLKQRSGTAILAI
jgi:hypothetical protein